MADIATAPLPGTADPTAGLKTIFSPETLVRKGLCPVTDIRHGQAAADAASSTASSSSASASAPAPAPTESHSLYYEQHGSGPEKVLFIMGLNSTSFAWVPQVEHFGRSDKYTILVFDNRGVGNSGTPRGPYSTSGMSEDVLVLLDHVGWTEPRGIHIVGISMGGMIAQELATRIPERIASLVLAVTTAGGRPWSNLPSWKGVTSLVTIMRTKDPKLIIPLIHEMVFPVPWLDSPASDGSGETNREQQTKIYHTRIAATRPQSGMGHLSQMAAGMGHRVVPERLAKISKSVPKVTIVTGDDDHLVDPRNSEWLATCMPEAQFEKWQGTGHAIHGQWPQRFNALLESTFEEGRRRLAEGWTPGATEA